MNATEVVLSNVRLSFVHLMKPYARDPQGEPKYQTTILLPKADTTGKAAIDAAIAAAEQLGMSGKWAGRAPAKVPTPIWDGDGLTQSGNEFGPECKGHWVFTASTSADRPVEVVGPNMQRILDQTQVYSGMYANICVNFFAYNYQGKKGIGCGLGPVQKVRDGEPLGGQPTTAKSVFSVIGGTAATAPAINPLTGQPM